MTRSTLITGATGFVGGRLLNALRGGEAPLRAIVRDASTLDDPAGVEVIEGDLADPAAVRRALDGCGLAYYLVHSMEAGADGDFATRDKELAEGFIEAAGELDVSRVIYLTGVVPGGGTSKHLESRQEVEEVLAGGAPDLVSLRASMVVGAESDSFRTLAQIVDRLPVLALPSWRDTKSQPVGIADVVAALLAAADVTPGVHEIAGPDTLTIEEMVKTIGELNGKVRPSFPLPFTSSRLEGAATALVADSKREVLEPLMEGLHDDLMVEENTLQTTFGVTPTPFRKAAAAALEEMRRADA